MKDKYIVKVTKTDIKNGWRNDEAFCPIALAFKRVARIKRISVDGAWVLANGEEFNGPNRADRFIERFDNDYEVKPCQFVYRKCKVYL